MRYRYNEEQDRWEARIMAEQPGDIKDRWLLGYFREIAPGLWACEPHWRTHFAWGAVYEEIRAESLHAAVQAYIDGYICTLSSTIKGEENVYDD